MEKRIRYIHDCNGVPLKVGDIVRCVKSDAEKDVDLIGEPIFRHNGMRHMQALIVDVKPSVEHNMLPQEVPEDTTWDMSLSRLTIMFLRTNSEEIFGILKNLYSLYDGDLNKILDSRRSSSQFFWDYALGHELKFITNINFLTRLEPSDYVAVPQFFEKC